MVGAAGRDTAPLTCPGREPPERGGAFPPTPRVSEDRPPLAQPSYAPSATELTLGHNVASEAEVDVVMEQALAAGAKLIKPAQPTFWGGYAGYFADPDGHLWEVVYNPELLPQD